MIDKLQQSITYLVYSTLWKIVRIAPANVAYSSFRLTAVVSYRLNGKRVKRLRENYRYVAPELSSSELEKLVRKGLSNAMRYWCDTFRISDWNAQYVQSCTRVINEEFLLDALRSKKGCIVVLPHAGNWDHAGLYFSSKGILVSTVAEHLKPDKLFRKFLEHRKQMGMQVFDIQSNALPELENLLGKGELVALVADRDLSHNGLTIKFFGHTAKMPVGPAILAYRTGAQILPAYVSYLDEGIEIKFSDPISANALNDNQKEVALVTQQIAFQFERDIALDPTSWHMQQRVFVGKDFQSR
jgi:KDO2-lipid IV(A) lauroyltransferase